MKFLSIAASLLAAGSMPLIAQDATPTPTASPSASPQASPNPDASFETITYWKAELPGGTYVVAHDSIIAVSTQEYVLDGAARVTEVNVSTSGVMQPRFYYIEALSVPGPTSAGAAAVDRAKTALEEAASRMVPGDPVWAKVIKTYPTTTHAGTIEYRLENKEQLKALFKSLEASWIAARSEVFRAEGAGGKGLPPGSKDKESQENSADAFANPTGANNSSDTGGL
jgi:hypothetical protein